MHGVHSRCRAIYIYVYRTVRAANGAIRTIPGGPSFRLLRFYRYERDAWGQFEMPCNITIHGTMRHAPKRLLDTSLG
jgi:hypothetical protein